MPINRLRVSRTRKQHKRHKHQQQRRARRPERRQTKSNYAVKISHNAASTARINQNPIQPSP
jgi:hypothetical protein